MISNQSSFKIDHLALYVRNLEEAKDFFVRFFHARSGSMYKNEKTGFRSYFIFFDDNSRLELMTRPEVLNAPKDVSLLGYHHFSVSVGGKELVDKLTQEISTAGWQVISGPRTTGDGYYESQIEGPEGNIIEITE